MTDLWCPLCGREGRSDSTYPFRCLCGGLWSLRSAGREMPRVSSPEPTPLWPDPDDPNLRWKREDVNPTGSFKDRGAQALIEVARRAGAERLVVDSSGNAALAAAAVAAAFSLPLTVHVPETISPAKREALEAMGAHVVARGSRRAAAARAREAARRAFYFSHVYHPAFFEGTAQSGYEVLEQTAVDCPRVWVVPVGNGSLLLGLGLSLLRSRREDIRLVAVQAAACPGLHRPGGPCQTRASGIAIADPPRREEILTVLRRYHGKTVEVSEDEIVEARERMEKHGVAVEGASAAAAAGVRRLREEGTTEPVVAWLTGSGQRWN